ncbi:HAD-IB family hydrolase [Brevundimonas sp. UBA2416]|uniref:HAD-IB family hydrolase n=1 Tax=Brevundimonas sp. UBA2416 TaxID=1946124 RepID=UPI0025BBEF0B|nr:HAD-IB family hydrolase [Brevundimonas sp. UBA2416]HRJ62823.1 HAD-IB family hydrolase [Brevundimonas sp.]
MSDMGSPALIHQPPRRDQAIVAFDFDGTLTVRDSFTQFLRWRAGAGGWIGGLARMTPDLAAYAGHRVRGRLKAASVREFLKGVPRVQLEADAEAFAGQVWPGFIRYDALACWKDWGERGAYRVIVTASPETTVAPFARRLEAEALLGTQLVFDADDRVAGSFAGPNCRGEEKVRRLRAAFGEDMQLAAAYGDTTGDTEMLAMADEAGFRRFKG